MKNTNRILSGLLVLVMVLSMIPVMAFADESETVTINIPTLANGTVTADQDSYEIGDTVTLTVAPAAGYVQKLYINGEPLLLDGIGNTYTFLAMENTYEVTGEFVPKLNISFGDAARWGTGNVAHGVLNTYYPNNNDSWYADFVGEYTSIAVIAKNELPIEESYEGNSKNGGYRIVLRMTLDNGKNYAFSIWIDTNKDYAYNHFGGGSSATGWGGAWCKTVDKNAEATAALNGDGAEFKLERIDGNHMQITLGGTVLETYTIPDVTEANKIVSVGVWQYGMKGRYVGIPFELTSSDVAVNLPAELENGSVTADKESYRKGDTVKLTVAPYDGYVQKLFINGEPLLLDGNVNTYSFVAKEDKYEITGGFVPKASWFWTSEFGMLNQGHNYVYAPANVGKDATGELVPAKGLYSGLSVLAKDTSHGDQKDYATVLKMTFTNGQKAEIRLIDRDDNGSYCLQVLGNNLLGNWATHYWLSAAESAAVKSGDGVWFGIHLEGTKIQLKIDNKIVKEVDVAASGITGVADIDQIKLQAYNFGYATHIQYRLHAIEAPAANVTIADTANGTVTADKDSYKIGDTVNLTIAANAGYAQKLYINGEPLILGWKTNTYSFVATQENYEITGSFEPADEGIKASDANRWDAANQAHGMLSTYYPSNNDGWWMNFNGDYKSLAVIAKNYWAISDTLDNFMVNLKVTMDNGNVYNFRVFTDKGGYTAYNRAGIKNSGDASADWGNWKNLSKFDSLITTEGVLFKVERTAADQLTLTVNGEVFDTYTMKGITAANKVATISVQHQGNKGTCVVMPYVLEKAAEHVHTPAEAVKENVKDATCTGAGSYDEVIYCAECGEEISRKNATIASPGHKYETDVTAPTCGAEGYTTYTCSACGDSYVSDKTPATGEHTWADDADTDCDVCGATREVGPAVDANLKFNAAPGLSFKDYIGMQILVTSAVAGNYDRVWIEAVQADPAGDITTTLEGVPYYYNMFLKFEQQVLSWSMAENITLTLYAEKDGVTVKGETFSGSVEDLAKAKIADYAAANNTKAVTALVDMLNYGAAVQVAFNHYADMLPNADLAYTGTVEVPTFDAENTKTGTGTVAIAKDSISMQAKVEIQLLFMVDVSAYTVSAKVAGADAPVVIDTEKYAAYGWTLVKVAVGADKMRQSFTISLNDANGNPVTQILNASVEAYGKAQLGGTYNDVVIAMMRYGDSVAAL